MLSSCSISGYYKIPHIVSSNNVIRLDIRKVSEDRGIGDKLKENLEMFRFFFIIV